MRPRAFLLAGVLGALTPVALAGLFVEQERAPRAAPSTVRAPSQPQVRVHPKPFLDGSSRAELRTIRRMSRHQADAVSGVVGPCLRRTSATPRARRAIAVRNCAFRPLAAVGASRLLNGMLLGHIRARVARGRCNQALGAYGGLLTTFAMTADTIVRTFPPWPQTRATLVSAGRLAGEVRSASRDAAWRGFCARGDGPRA